MVSISALLLALVLPLPAPQGTKGGKLVLPPVKVQKPEQKPDPKQLQPSSADQQLMDAFRRDLQDVGRAGRGADTVLDRLGETYLDLPALIRKVLPLARGKEMKNLLQVMRRFGGLDLALDLTYQLQVRALGSAADDAVQTVHFLYGEKSKPHLFQLCRSRFANVRAASLEILVGLVTADDLAAARSFLAQRSLDSSRAGVRLLAAIHHPEARRELVAMLSVGRSRDLTLCAYACRGLIDQGEEAVPDLRVVLAAPAIDQAFGYAAFALAAIERKTGRDILEPGDMAGLQRELRSPDTLQRSLVAVSLARLAWRQPGPLPDGGDREVAAALLEIVAPTGYTANFDLLQRPTEQALVLLTGQYSLRSPSSWREWWQVARDGFVAMRRSVVVTPENAGRAAVILREGQRIVQMFGEDLAPSVSDSGRPTFLLTTEQISGLIEELQSLGLMHPALERMGDSPLPKVRSIEVRLDTIGYRIAATSVAAPWFDRLSERLHAEEARERWQFYRHPVDEPDAAAFWRAERRWLAEHPDAADRNRRLLGRILKVWPVLPAGSRRTLAVEHMLSLPDVAALIGEQEGEQLVALAAGGEEVGELELRLLELAVAAPGDKVWRRVLDVVDRQLESAAGAGADALARRGEMVVRLFRLLGSDRVVAALDDPRPRVRIAAIQEVVEVRARAAGPKLLDAIGSEHNAEVRMAVYALGQLRYQPARRPLMNLVVGADTLPALRQEGMVALGRIGGDGVVDLLRSALPSPSLDDKAAAVRGLGFVRVPEASRVLATVFAAHQGADLGELARLQLLAHGALLAVPALREIMDTVPMGPDREDVVRMLGAFQDPEVVGELTALLDGPSGSEQLSVVAMIENATGVDLAAQNDRVGFMTRWWTARRRDPQTAWYLHALQAHKQKIEENGGTFETSLIGEQLTAEAGMAAVPELARLLTTLEPARLRVLTAVILRRVTGTEFGRVTAASTRNDLETVATRYRYLADAAKAASGR